jgi:hypothetical protein
MTQPAPLNTTLGGLQPDDEIMSIGTTPAARVTTGIPFPTTGTQRLLVRTAKVFGRHAIVTFANGGCLTACAAATPCTAVRSTGS